MKIKELKSNPDNPRLIKDDKFLKLVKSIEQFPKMMELRPIIIDENNIILGGNMRFKALQELKYKDIPDEWVKRASDLTDDEKQEFIIKDNVSFGEHDFDILKESWNEELLNDWGLECNFSDNEEPTKKTTKELVPYKKTHILLSFNPQDILKLKPFLDEILKIEGIEYEQSSN